MHFEKYHFHIYFQDDELKKAQELVRELTKIDHLGIGEIREKPVGPHPIGSCQITVLSENFNQIVEWFLLHRKDLSILIHAVSGNHVLDHTKYVMWIGKPYELNLDVFYN